MTTIVLVALGIAPGFLFFYDITPKAAGLVTGAAAALLLLAWRRREAETVAGRWLILLAMFWASLAVSSMLSPYPELSVTGSNWRRLGLWTWTSVLILSYAACIHTGRDGSRIRAVLAAVAGSGVVVSVYGIAQFFGWDPLLPASGYHIGEGEWVIVRPPATLGHATYFATFLLSAAGASAGLALTANAGSFARSAWTGAALLASAAIVLSGTRAAILGLFTGGMILTVWLRPHLRVRALAAAVLICTAGAAFYFSPYGQKLRSRTRWYQEDPLGGPRLLLWRDSMRLAGAHWLAGSGPETFSREFPNYQSPDLSRRLPDFHHESPHNVFLDVFTAQGMVGLVLFGLLIYAGIQSGWRAREWNPRLSGVLIASLAAALSAQMFSSLTISGAVLLFVNLGMLEALRKAPGGLGTLRHPLARPVSLIAACVLMTFATRLAVADRQLRITQELLESGQVAAAIDSYAANHKWRPAAMDTDLWFSRALLAALAQEKDLPTRFAAWRQLMKAARQSTDNAEDLANAWYSLAQLKAVEGDAASVEAYLKRAIAASPNWYKPHWSLAKLLQLQGRLEEASREAATGVDISAGKLEEVLQTAKEIQNQLK